MLPTLPSNRDTLFPHDSSRYRPLGQIGRGGMAEVILVEMRDGPGGPSLAVMKRIWPHLACQPAFLSMFRNEAQVCVSLNHPNIVKTYELAEGPERPSIVMEYLDGQPLARVLNRLVGPDALSMTLRTRIVVNVLAALHYAHELHNGQGKQWGIVHRDVNPQNVFITYDGEVKLVDFGVAKTRSSTDHARPPTAPGTVAYMAPEQLQGGVVDRRADLFSVGVMLWEMIAGQRLWQGMTESTIVRHLTKRIPIPATATFAAGNPALNEIVSRALSYDPEKRYPTAAAFQAALEPLLPGHDDSHGRRLGHVVSLAFAKERATRRDLIEQHLGDQPASSPRAVPHPAGRNPTRPTTPPPPPPLPSLRPSRPTPGGMWSLSDPTPAGPTLAPATSSSSSFVTLITGPRWPRTRWAAFGAGLAACTILLVVAFHIKARAFTGPAASRQASPSSTTSPMLNAIVVSPLRPRSVIPWPLPTPPSFRPTPDATDDGPRAPAGLHDSAMRRLTRPPVRGADSDPLKQSAGPRRRGRTTRATGLDEAAPPSPQHSEDDILAPTIDLSDS